MGRGFSSQEKYHYFKTDCNIMRVWRNMVPKRGSNPNSLAGIFECKGQVTRVMPIRNEESGTRVSSMKSDILLKHRHLLSTEICPGLLLESKFHSTSSLSLPLSMLLSALLYLNSCCSLYTWGDPGWNISASGSVQVVTQHLTSNFLSPIQNTSSGEERISL